MARAKRPSRAEILSEIAERTEEIKQLRSAQRRRDELFKMGRALHPPILFTQLAEAAEVTSTAVQQAVARQ